MIEAEAMDGARAGEEEGSENEGIGSIEQIRPDPFVQPPILKALFEQLPVEELARCRLVSKLWYEESLSTWRSKATLKFGKKGVVSKGANGSRLTTPLGEFLDLWEEGEWGSCPFKKFTLRSWTFKAGKLERERFLELVGGHITSLTLVRCSFVGRENFRRTIYQAFPKLQLLKMEDCNVEYVAHWYEPEEKLLAYEEPAFSVHGLKSLDIFNCEQCDPHSMMDLFSHFHKLESLQLEAGKLEYRSLLEVISLIRAEDQTKLPLKDFDFDFKFRLGGEHTARSIELLKLHDQLNLPLQRLKILFDREKNMDRALRNQEAIRDVLQYHTSTLKNLGFFGDDQPGLWICKSFPFGFNMKNLETLVIRLPRFSDNLNYLWYAPNLRVLEIGDNNDLTLEESDNIFSNSSQLEIGDWTLPALKTLRFDLKLSLCNMKKLMKWMPNVERIWGMELDDAKFKMVCKHWRNMKDLSDWGHELTDAGVIGRGNEADGDEETRSESGSGPNIIKLKGLVSFETWSRKLTSASVHDGFLKLANLKKLTLPGSTKVDSEAKAALKSQKVKLDQFQN